LILVEHAGRAFDTTLCKMAGIDSNGFMVNV
jgi:hypothetical protein